MAQNNNNAKPKLQGSMEYIIILAIVIIVALTAGVYYLSSVHNAKVGALNNIVSAQASSSNTLVLKLSTTLPAGAQVKSINLTGVPSGTSISVSLESQTPVYSNGYPEYSFSVSGLPEPLPYYNVTSLTYEVNGKTITVPTITGEPIAIEEASSYSNSNSNSFPKPTSIPSGILDYVPIKITNSQDSPTPSPFQQMIQISKGNYASYITYNGNFANFEFFTQSGSVLPAWIESNNSGTLTVWVNLPNGIPASSSLTIYLGFASKTTNLLSSSGTSGIGEAPQLSSTYAEYDDGASVFNNYWNFAGTSTPSGINVYTSSGSVTFNNGVTIKGGTSTTNGANGVSTSASFSAPIIVDYYGTQSTSPSGSSWAWNEPGFSNYLNAVPNTGGTYTLIIFAVGYAGQPSTSQGGTATNGGLSTPSSNLFPASVWTHVYTSSTYYTYQNYINNTGYITGASNTASLPFEIEVGNNEATYVSNGMTVYWLRTRAYPPNGVMPSVSFSGLSTA